MKKSILLIVDDPSLEHSLKEILGADYRLEVARKVKTALDHLAERTPAAVLIDLDLKEQDGIKVLKLLKTTAPAIILSSVNNIPLAVAAAKLGAADFLHKPLNAKQLKESIEKVSVQQEQALLWPCLPAGRPAAIAYSYLDQPESELVKGLKQAVKKNDDIILLGESGVPKEQVAELIHLNGGRKNRRLVKLDLRAFRDDSLEATFWAAIKKLISLPAGLSAQVESDLCGTVYLENFSLLNNQFQHTIINFFSTRKGEIDQQVRIIFDLPGPLALEALQIKPGREITIPPLKERKEGISRLLPLLLKEYSLKYNKQVLAVSAPVLEFLFAYDYPANDLEFTRLVELAVIAAKSDKLELANFPLSPAMLLGAALKKGPEDLAEARAGFERSLYETLLAKTDGNRAAVASFLDLPKSVLAERLEYLLH